MDTCEQCGAELDPAMSHLHKCETGDWQEEEASYCMACGLQIDNEFEWGEEGLCVSCAEEYAGLP